MRRSWRQDRTRMASFVLNGSPRSCVMQVRNIMRLDLKRRRQGGFSLIELLIVIAIILIILAVALPKLTSARRYAQEMAAVKAITTIHTAETQYYSQYGAYATTLQQLGPPASGTT